jgi:hypothetical protein
MRHGKNNVVKVQEILKMSALLHIQISGWLLAA